MESIILGGKKYSYSVTKKSISSLRLHLKTSHSFIISCPRLTPKFIIIQFINKNSSWIISHSQKIPVKKSIKNLKSISILEKKYQLIFIKTARDSVIIYPDTQKIYINTSIDSSAHIEQTLEKKLRPFALSLIKDQLSVLKKEYGFNYQNVTVRNQSSRYGSCSSRGNLNFNWQIIFFPVDKFRHILLHELTHLKIKNHSKIFWDQLTIYDLNCKANNLWLKKEGTKLFLF
jgi:predicted metal-dependent hydrolase